MNVVFTFGYYWVYNCFLLSLYPVYTINYTCTKHELFLWENYKTKQYEKSVLKQCGLNLLYGGEAVQEMFDSIAFALT